MKSPELIEYRVKGFANRNRVRLILAIKNNPGISVEALADLLKLNYQTMSVHLRQLYRTGLVTKSYKGKFVEHKLTSDAESIVALLEKL